MLDQPVASVKPLFNLGAVCSHWRHTAWSSPRLWTRIVLSRVSPPPCDLEGTKKYVSFLGLFYNNLGGLKIEMSVLDARRVWRSDKLETKIFWRMVLKEHGTKLRSLHAVLLNRHSWAAIESLCKAIEFPFLEEVDLSWERLISPRNHSGIIFRQSPRLIRPSTTLTSDDIQKTFPLKFP